MHINPINFGRLLNSEHVTLSAQLKAIIEKHLEALPELDPLYIKLDTLVDAEFHAFKVINSSEFTEEKQRLDRIRNNSARQLLLYVRSFEFSEDAAEAAAARLLLEILKDVPTIVEESYRSETADLFALTATLNEEPFAPAVEMLGAMKLVEKVYDRNSDFASLVAQQIETDSAKDSGNMRAVRKPVDAELRRAFRIIENRFDREMDTDDVRTCVKELNYEINAAQTTMKLRLSRGKKGENQPPAAAPENDSDADE